MDKHQFLSKVKSIDEQAYIKLKRISHIAVLDLAYAERIRYAKMYLQTDMPSRALVGLFNWDETLEGDDYWWHIFKKLVLNYK